jgi:hypothetical protein
MDAKWILKGLVESVFVVASILLALAVDEYQQNRDYAELADQSLAIFEREIRQNRARLDDVVPYHRGINDLLGQMRGFPEREVDLRSIMEGLTSPVLLSTAWETALATGSLTHMEFDLVSALSLTYSIQSGFAERTRVDRPRFSVPQGLTPFQNRQQLDEAYEYMTSLTRDESELLAVFDQALDIITTRRDRDGSEPPRPTTAHP